MVTNGLDLYNNEHFREASLLVWKARLEMYKIEGLSKSRADEWVRTWASGAGDGIA